MPATLPTTLEQVRQSLRAVLPEELRFGLVTTRLIFRTGVDLTAPLAADRNRDPALVARVLAALQDMGYPLSR